MRSTSQSPQPPGRTATSLFVLLCLAAFIGVDPGFGDLDRQWTFMLARYGPLGLGAYMLAYVCAAGAWALLLLNPHRWVRSTATAVTALGLCVHLAVWAVNGYGFELWEARMFFHEVAHAGDVAQTFGWGAAGSILSGLAITATLAIARSRLRLRHGRSPLLLLLVAVGPVAFTISYTNGEVSSFPPPLKVPVVTVLGNLPGDTIGDRGPPTLRPTLAPLAPHVLLIVDESVRGDMLGINGGPDTTPWLASQAPPMVNLGIACASTNSSAPSNMVIQSGIQPDELRRDPAAAMTMPNLFQYARASGHETSYLLGQTIRYWYYMNPSDLDHLDQLVQPADIGRGTPDPLVDRRVMELAVQSIDRSSRSFTYVLKLGAHFPYGEKRPEGYWPLDGPLFPDEPDPDRSAMLDDYGRTLRYVVDDYFKELLPRLEGRDVVVIYTSDHGQSLREGGILATHGVARTPPTSQANVPLLILGTSPKTRALVAGLMGQSRARLRDRASHFELFPTILTLMGYDPSEVEQNYGPSLFTADGARPRFFLSGDPFRQGPETMNRFDR